MNKLNLLISSAIVALVAANTVAFAQTAPVTSLDQSTGLLGSPIAQLPVNDPVIQQAIDWIHNQSKPADHHIQRKPDTTISRFRNEDDRRTVILGGPEVVPM